MSLFVATGRTNISLLILLVACSTAFGYIYTCLDNCDCDTDDEAIHCHSGERETLHMPATRLRGFSVIGLTRNNIRQLPSQTLLLQKFPDLKAVDVEGNPNFNCSSLDYYTKVVVMSDCGKSADELLNSTLPSTIEPTADCDFACQRDRHVKALQDYLIRLWRMIKAKVAELKRENKWMQDVENFFAELSQKVAATLKELGAEEPHDDARVVVTRDRETNVTVELDTEAPEQHVHFGNAVGRRKFSKRR